MRLGKEYYVIYNMFDNWDLPLLHKLGMNVVV